MERHNRRLSRIARSILRNDGEPEGAGCLCQRLYPTRRLSRRTRPWGTWLPHITMNEEALGRLRHERPTDDLEVLEGQRSTARIIQFPQLMTSDDPEQTMARREILQLVERATENLPEILRIVLMARVIEEMSVEETAELLCLQPATVKTRLHRARRLLREELNRQIGPS
jgi:RNA polymerase sigma-70 factor, ECF subfamily